jgi:microcystin degradation protein MlrC
VEPLPLEVEVISRSEGRFVPEGDRSLPFYLPESRVDMGPCAVVQHEAITVLLTSRRTTPFDLAQWRSQGVEPEDFFVIGLKAATEHRPAYDRIAEASYVVDVPGPCAENLRLLPFENVTRPIYPLDEL